MQILDAPQGSIEWLTARAGRVTASRVADVLDKLKNGNPGSKRASYLWQVVEETLTGRPAPCFVNAAMQWGTETEPFANAAYTDETGFAVRAAGLIVSDEVDRLAYSPDGLIDAHGLLEIKCPNTATHLQRLRDGVVPDAYKPQMATGMLVTGRSWCDYYDYDPRLPLEFQAFKVRYTREDAADLIETIKVEVPLFLAEVDQIIEDLKNRF